VDVTYFLQRIDLKMFMLILYYTKKSEKDSPTQKFLNEFTLDLKCQKIFGSLKSQK